MRLMPSALPFAQIYGAPPDGVLRGAAQNINGQDRQSAVAIIMAMWSIDKFIPRSCHIHPTEAC